MKDEEFNQRMEEVEKVIEELEEGEVSLKEGRKLKKKGLKMLESIEDVLNIGKGKTAILKDKGDKILEETNTLAEILEND